MAIEEILFNGLSYKQLYFKRNSIDLKNGFGSVLEGPLKEKTEQANIVRLVLANEKISFQEVEFVQWGYYLGYSDEEIQKTRTSIDNWTNRYAYDQLEFNFGHKFKQPFDKITGKNEEHIDSSSRTTHFRWASKTKGCLIELQYKCDLLTLSLSAFGRSPHPLNIVSEYVENVKSTCEKGTRGEGTKTVLEFAKFRQRKGLYEQGAYTPSVEEFIENYCFKCNKSLAHNIENSKLIML
ncbi:MAG: hypothetical protein HY363_00595 [Candidatus Aenigmarchaeota archaeon]|nr:hypothetical protein [Candidatus Aenigmarchaeota archaeon]